MASQKPARYLQLEFEPEDRSKINKMASALGMEASDWAEKTLLDIAEKQTPYDPKGHEKWHRMLQEIFDADSAQHTDWLTGNLMTFHELLVRQRAVPAPSRKRA